MYFPVKSLYDSTNLLLFLISNFEIIFKIIFLITSILNHMCVVCWFDYVIVTHDNFIVTRKKCTKILKWWSLRKYGSIFIWFSLLRILRVWQKESLMTLPYSINDFIEGEIEFLLRSNLHDIDSTEMRRGVLFFVWTLLIFRKERTRIR